MTIFVLGILAGLLLKAIVKQIVLAVRAVKE